MHSKDYKQAVVYAEQLLLSRENSAKEMVAIHCALSVARCELAEYSGAVVAGETAVRLARDIEEWDYFGRACMDLGTAYYHLGDHDHAITCWLEFLSALTFYQKSAQYEALVRYNLGFAQTARGEFAEAHKTLEKAISAAVRLGDERLAHAIRQGLASSLLKAGHLSPIPRLLAQCSRYLRYHREAAQIRESQLWYTSIRIQYAVLTDRLVKARRLAVRGLDESEGSSEHQFEFHMLLARTASQRGSAEEALGHSEAAMIIATHCHRHDLESQAGELFYHVTMRHPGITQVMDQYYLLDAFVPIEEELHLPWKGNGKGG